MDRRDPIQRHGNFILSEMRRYGASFPAVLKEAQARGYAEADPAFDVDGIDAAHKLAIISGDRLRGADAVRQVPTPKAFRSSCTRTSATPRSSRYRIKLLGITRRAEKGIELRVHPTSCPRAAADRQRPKAR